jgi:protein-disulfide isomerase
MEPNNQSFNQPPLQQMPTGKENSSVLIALAIIIAGLMISGTLIAKSFMDNSKQVIKTNPSDAAIDEQVEIQPITNADHILGNPKATVLIVEYSDTECPYCKQYHKTLQQVIKDLGADGKVAWVYRHFPLYKGTENQPPLHSKAGKESEATECAAELAGNNGFWSYINRLYEITPANNGLDISKLYDIAVEVGIDKAAFTTCLDSGKYADKISKDYDDAILAGARGTPYTVLLDTRTGKTTPLNGGAMSYSTLKTIIESILSQLP